MLIAPLLLTVGMQVDTYHAAPFQQEVGTRFTAAHGLPSPDVRSIAISGGTVWAATAAGIARMAEQDGTSGRWSTVSREAAVQIAPDGRGGIYAARGGGFAQVAPDGSSKPLADLGRDAGIGVCGDGSGGAWCLTAKRAVHWSGAAREQVAAPPDTEFTFVFAGPDKHAYLGARVVASAYTDQERGQGTSYIHRLYRLDGARLFDCSDMRDVRGRYADGNFRAGACDPAGHVWVATSGGVAVTDGKGWWQSFGGREGVPLLDGACLALAPGGDLWFGTSAGACRLRDGQWSCFAGRRWLPGDDVRAIAAGSGGNTWVATDGGVGLIAARPMTLAEKAAHYEEITRARHDRGGYVTVCRLKDPENLQAYEIEASDNDGLWTALYCAAECFRYAATGDAAARDAARRSMHAIIDLERLSGIPGFPARAVVRDGETHVYLAHGEWRRSTVDPAFQWKGDTSSDELDGHYFVYPIYYDLVADAAEKETLRGLVRRMTDHLIRNGYRLVDMDGKPTRWAIFGPQDLNDTPFWESQRGLNSLSMLKNLKAAIHVTGEPRYTAAYDELIRRHHYAINAIDAKMLPPNDVNHSDDQLAFLSYYALLRYEEDPDLRRILLQSLHRSWQVERPERSALFNVIYGGVTGLPCDVGETVRTLREWPWDLRHWNVRNRGRADVAIGPLSTPDRVEGVRVLPASERRTMQWSDNPWVLDAGADGQLEYDGAAYLLPYWMARYHRLLAE